MRAASALALLALASAPMRGASKHVSGVLRTSECFAFVTSFEFGTSVEDESNILTYAVQTPALIPDLKFAVFHESLSYDGGLSSWNNIFTGVSTCQQRYEKSVCQFNLKRDSMPTTTNDINKFIRHDGAFTCEAFERGGRVFVTLMNFDYDKCNTTTASGKSILCAGPVMNVTYDVSMQNKHLTWTHFDQDSADLLTFIILFFFLCLGLAIFAVYVATALKKKDMMHHTVSLLLYSSLCIFISMLCNLVHYSNFARNGEGVNSFRIAGTFFYNVADWMFLMLVILVGKGWTIVRRKIKAGSRMKIAVLGTLYGCAQISGQCWYELEYHEAGAWATEVDNTPPGVMSLIVRAVCWLYFVYAVYVCLRNYGRKKGFYYKYTFFMTIWFFLPMTWFRLPERGNIISKYLALYLFQWVSLTMYNPNMCNVGGFPFHATVSEMQKGPGERNAGGPVDPLTQIKGIVDRVGNRLTLLSEHAGELASLLLELDPETGDRDVDLPSMQAPSFHSFGSENAAHVTRAHRASLNALNHTY